LTTGPRGGRTPGLGLAPTACRSGIDANLLIDNRSGEHDVPAVPTGPADGLCRSRSTPTFREAVTPGPASPCPYNAREHEPHRGPGIHTGQLDSPARVAVAAERAGSGRRVCEYVHISSDSASTSGEPAGHANRLQRAEKDRPTCSSLPALTIGQPAPAGPGRPATTAAARLDDAIDHNRTFGREDPHEASVLTRLAVQRHGHCPVLFNRRGLGSLLSTSDAPLRADDDIPEKRYEGDIDGPRRIAGCGDRSVDHQILNADDSEIVGELDDSVLIQRHRRLHETSSGRRGVKTADRRRILRQRLRGKRRRWRFHVHDPAD
jgi:hypothetical protein